MAPEDQNSETSTPDASNEANLESILFQETLPTGGVDHTPIIITDGSAAIEFAESQYPRDSQNPNRRVSTGLHLVKISAKVPHNPTDNPESRNRVCLPLVAGELYEIEFTCTRGGQAEKNFVIGGGPTFSPVILFDHAGGGEYQQNAGNFPPIDLGQRFGNLDRDITRLRIYRIENGGRVLMHECRLSLEGCEYRILDIH